LRLLYDSSDSDFMPKSYVLMLLQYGMQIPTKVTSQIGCEPFKISQQSMMLQNGWLRERDLLQNDPRFRFLGPWDTHSVKFQRGSDMNW